MDPSDSGVSEDSESPLWVQLMLAAGFPLSALHTATILSPGSNQADNVGATEPGETEELQKLHKHRHQTHKFYV